MERGGLELAVVVGGGNIWRGATGAMAGMNRANSDLMGMLGTVINALALQDAIESHGRATRVMSAIDMDQVAEPYIRRRAVRHLEKSRVVIFAAGMGNPYFTTDTPGGPARRRDRSRDCAEGHARRGGRRLLRGPARQPQRDKFDEISFDEVIARNLRVMDMTAITFCKDNHLPLRVFDLMADGNLGRALDGQPVGTLVK